MIFLCAFFTLLCLGRGESTELAVAILDESTQPGNHFLSAFSSSFVWQVLSLGDFPVDVNTSSIQVPIAYEMCCTENATQKTICLPGAAPTSPYFSDDFSALQPHCGNETFFWLSLQLDLTVMPAVGVIGCGSTNSSVFDHECLGNGYSVQQLEMHHRKRKRQSVRAGTQATGGSVSTTGNFLSDDIANNMSLGIATVDAQNVTNVRYCFSTMNGITSIDLSVTECAQLKIFQPNSTVCSPSYGFPPHGVAGFSENFAKTYPTSPYCFYQVSMNNMAPAVPSAGFIGWGQKIDSVCGG